MPAEMLNRLASPRNVPAKITHPDIKPRCSTGAT